MTWRGKLSGPEKLFSARIHHEQGASMTEQQLAWKGAKALLHRHGGAKAETKTLETRKVVFCADPPRARGASMAEQQLARKGAKALLR